MKVEVAVLGSPVRDIPYGLCGRKATVNLNKQSVRLLIAFLAGTGWNIFNTGKTGCR